MSFTSDRPHRLSPSQVAQYRRDGYWLYRQPVFSPERFAALQALFEELLDRYGDDDLDSIHFREPRLLDFLLADEVLDLVTPVVGPNIALWSSHFISKAPRTGKATPWHEDSAYWHGRVSTMENIVTVWLALDHASPENGCMRVIPGSHHLGGLSEYVPISAAENIFDREIRPDRVNEAQAVYFSLTPNTCSLHDARIIHGARANTSERRRAGYTMRYLPTSTRVHPDPNGHKIWLARGVDLAGNRYENA